MSNPTNGLVFARVTSYMKTRAGKHSYSLSNNSTVVLDKNELSMGEWYFLHLKVTAAKHYAYVSHHAVTKQEGEEFELQQKNLHQYATKAEAAWSSLEQAEKAVIAKTIGTALAGTAAAGFLIDAATSVLVEGITGLATGGLSLLFGGGLAVMSAISWEERCKAVKQQENAIKNYLTVQAAYKRWLNRLCPMSYMGLQPLDPELSSFVLRMKKVFTDFNWNDVTGVREREMTFNFATA
jgi:hypothetical protein